MTLRSYIGIVALSLVWACGGTNTPDDEPAPRGGGVTIEVQNNRTAQATVYVIVQGGSRRRVGEVQAASRKEFTVLYRPNIAVLLRFLAEENRVTPTMAVQPGDVITVIAPPRGPLQVSRR